MGNLKFKMGKIKPYDGRAGFYDLPREIRDEIYELAFTTSAGATFHFVAANETVYDVKTWTLTSSAWRYFRLFA